MSETEMTLTEAAEYFGVTRQAIYQAIKVKKIHGYKTKSNRWRIPQSEVEAYIVRRYNREYAMFEGKPLFNKELGEIGVSQAARKFNVRSQKIYYWLRGGYLPYQRRGAAYILLESDLKECMRLFRNNAKKVRSTPKSSSNPHSLVRATA